MSAITQNIIFRIGSEMGPGGLASLKAGFDMTVAMTSAVIKHVQALEEFLDVQQNVRMDLSKVETNVRALTGSLSLMSEANRLTQAKVKMTGEEFAAVAKSAAAFADATGIQTSEALHNLVSGLISGNERGLRPFGINLDEAKTKTEKTTEAIKQLTERAKELNPQLDTTTEKIKGLTDAWTRYIANMMGQVGEVKIISEAFTFWIEVLNEYSDRVDQINSSQSFAKLADQLHELNVQQMAALKAGNFDLYYKLQEKAGPLEERAGLRGPSAPAEDITEFGPSPEQLAEIAYDRNTSRGGGGRRKEAYKPTEAAQLATIGTIDIENQAVQAQFENTNAMMAEALQNNLETASNYKEAAYNYEVMKYREAQELILAEQQRRYEIEADAMQSYKISEVERMLGIEQQYVNASAALWKSGLQGKMATLSIFFNSVSQLMTVKSKAAFEIGKAGAIAEGLVNTYLAAIKAMQALSGAGPAGPVLGVIAAAAITAAGLANVNRIRQMKYEGGGGDSRGAEMPSLGGATGPSSNAGGEVGSFTPPKNEPQEIKITINMGDDAMFFDAIVDHNDKAARTGRRYFKQA